MDRNLNGHDLNRQNLLYNNTLSDLTTRFDVPVTVTSTVGGMMGSFANMVIDDIIVTQRFFINEKGIYDIFMYCVTNKHSASTVFRIDGQEIIGFVDFYTPLHNVTVKRIEGVVINGSRKISLHIKTETKDPESTGYNVTIGDIWFAKRE
jgi:hypothetical protein